MSNMTYEELSLEISQGDINKLFREGKTFLDMISDPRFIEGSSW